MQVLFLLPGKQRSLASQSGVSDSEVSHQIDYQFTIIVHASVLRSYVWRKSDLPLYIGKIPAFYFDTTPCNLSDNVNTKSA